MQLNNFDLGNDRIPSLFRAYLLPTLVGMLSICGVTAIDGIFIGHGVGSDGLAAVNIAYAPIMAFTGVGLMLGIGASVVSSIALADGDTRRARLNITRAMLAGTVVALLFIAATMISPQGTARLLGSSESLMPLVLAYMTWIFPSVIFQMWTTISLFVIRLDGAPKYAMWCNLVPAILNTVLDYVFIFPLGMGMEGAAIATCISCAAGGIMALTYIFFFAKTLHFIRLRECLCDFREMLADLRRQCKIGLPALLSEATMGMLAFIGNILFMRLAGDNGVGAFSIACYYMPFILMLGNAIAQSAQPIISFNYGLGQHGRVVNTEKLAIASAAVIGIFMTIVFMVFPYELVGLFLSEDTPAVHIAAEGLPKYALAFLPFVFNLTGIGYFQSVERNAPSLVFSLLRGAVFIIPVFFAMAHFAGLTGLWLALAVSEAMTAVLIIALFAYTRRHARRAAAHHS